MAIAMTSNTWRGLGTWAKPLSNASPQSAHSSLAYFLVFSIYGTYIYIRDCQSNVGHPFYDELLA